MKEPLSQGGRTSTDADPRRLRSALVVAEIAATLVLLVGAGLLGQTLYRMRYVDLGLQPQGLLTLRTVLPSQKYGEPERRAAFYEEVLERVTHLPGVVGAGYGTSVPLEWKGGTSGFVPEGMGRPEPGLSYDANHREVSADFLRTLGVPLRQGRFIERTDGALSRPVAVVNETMARQYWPGQDAVGKRFKVGDPDSDVPWVTIVGIVGDVRQMGLDAPVKAEMYLPYSQAREQPWFAPRDLAVRTSAPADEPRGLGQAGDRRGRPRAGRLEHPDLRRDPRRGGRPTSSRSDAARGVRGARVCCWRPSGSTASCRTSWRSTRPRSACASPWARVAATS